MLLALLQALEAELEEAIEQEDYAAAEEKQGATLHPLAFALLLSVDSLFVFNAFRHTHTRTRTHNYSHT